uniref:Uncharacterized protein n=1 Tax=Solanum tuberosum TaxID=4113 RepID=M1A8U7_SOLTU
MSMLWFITTLAITAFICSSAYAYDNNPLQDICVAVNDSHASGKSSFYILIGNEA